MRGFGRISFGHVGVLAGWICLAACNAPPAAGQEATTAAPAVDPNSVVLYLADGSMLAGKLSIDAIEVETSFGTLKVPIASLKSFAPGLGSKPQLNKQIVQWIDQLGSAEYAEREAAQVELRGMGESIRPLLTKHVADADKERRDRVKQLLDELDESSDDDAVDPKSVWLTTHDVVETNEFTAVGRIITTEFEVQSKYGPLTIKLSDLRRCQRPGDEPKRIEKSLAIDEQNLVQRTLKDTGIRVEKGDQVTISADGTIKMSPWGSNAFSTPDGGQNFGWLVPGSISGGTLVATIGNNTSYLRVGARSSIRAPRGGMLRLGIAMQQDHAGNQFPGGYQVKVVVERQ
jgi:hypothetical protein